MSTVNVGGPGVNLILCSWGVVVFTVRHLMFSVLLALPSPRLGKKELAYIWAAS